MPLFVIASHQDADAVDYPKTGMPVPHREIPQPPSPLKPDWHANELNELNRDHYRSARALGHLFRAIELPALREAAEEARAQRREFTARKPMPVEEIMKLLMSNRNSKARHPVIAAIRKEATKRLEIRVSRRTVEELIAPYDRYC